ncbi:MAG: (d)CMP kinase [Bacteroidota bacterium]
MKRRKRGIIIAIDGTAASGKSTTARALAHLLGYGYLDTGAMYRAMALKILRAGIRLPPTISTGSSLITEVAPETLSQIDSLAENTSISVRNEKGSVCVYLDGEDVTDLIRTQEVSSMASIVSTLPRVREVLVREQRRAGQEGGIVAEGRDIGTIVFPDAELKIFMTASLDERARRRKRELLVQGAEVSDEEVKRELRERDERDSSRAYSPLRKAPDAVELDTTKLTIDEQVKIVMNLAQKRISSGKTWICGLWK